MTSDRSALRETGKLLSIIKKRSWGGGGGLDPELYIQVLADSDRIIRVSEGWREGKVGSDVPHGEDR